VLLPPGTHSASLALWPEGGLRGRRLQYRLPPMINAGTVKLERFVWGLGRGMREVNSLFTSCEGTQSNWSTCPHLGVVVCIGCSEGLIGGSESIEAGP